MIRFGEIELGESAGLDPLFDRLRCGYLKALKDMLNVEFDQELFPEEDSDDERS